MLFVHGGASGAGTQTAAIGMAGIGPGGGNTSSTQTYDGTAFATSATINTARVNTGGGGNLQSGAIFFGGPPPQGADVTEEFSDVTTAAEAADISFD